LILEFEYYVRITELQHTKQRQLELPERQGTQNSCFCKSMQFASSVLFEVASPPPATDAAISLEVAVLAAAVALALRAVVLAPALKGEL